MKKALVHLAVLTLAAASLVHGADTPAAIAADYRTKAAAALAKVNDTLEKATVPLVAALVKSGDTAGADLLKEQLKAKIAGEPVAMPQPTAVALFKSYDAARAKALEPAQQTAVKRIDAVLASSEGKKLDVVSELGKVRAEVESSRTASNLPDKEEWSYHMTANAKPNGKITLMGDGTLELVVNGKKETGTWSRVKKNLYTMVIGSESFETPIDKGTAVMKRPIGDRFLKRIEPPQP